MNLKKIFEGGFALKIISVIFALLVAFQSTCYAMNFSQKIAIGSIIDEWGVGYFFEKVSENQGKEFASDDVISEFDSKYIGKGYYKNGIARFGEDEDSLFLHYGGEYLKIGSQNISNTVNINGGEFISIFQLKNDSKIKMYLISVSAGFPENIFLIGKREDGRFVKYIDTLEITKKYFGESHLLLMQYDSDKVLFEKGRIIVRYLCRKPFNINYPKYEVSTGEFILKWDEKAQWFGVEQVKN